MLAESMQVDLITLIGIVAGALGVGGVSGRYAIRRTGDGSSEALGGETRKERDERIRKEVEVAHILDNLEKSTAQTAKTTYKLAQYVTEHNMRIDNLERAIGLRQDTGPISVTGPHGTVE